MCPLFVHNVDACPLSIHIPSSPPHTQQPQAKLQPCVRSKAGAVTAEELKALAAQLHAHAQQPGAPQAVVTLAQAAAAILESTTYVVF